MIYLPHKAPRHKKEPVHCGRELGFYREQRDKISRENVYLKVYLKAIQKVPLHYVAEDSTSRCESLGLPAEALRAKAGAAFGS